MGLGFGVWEHRFGVWEHRFGGWEHGLGGWETRSMGLEFDFETSGRSVIGIRTYLSYSSRDTKRSHRQAIIRDISNPPVGL